MNDSNIEKPRWSIRECREDDAEGILELRRVTLGGNRDIRWWKWMFLNGPDGPTVFWLAEAGDKVVGMNPGLPLRLKVGDRICKSALGFDVMVHPDYRRQGVLNSLSKIGTQYRVDNGFDVDYGTSTPQRFPVYQKLKITHKHIAVAHPHLMVKVLDWGLVLKSHYRIPAFLGTLLGYIWDHIRINKSSLSDNDIDITRITSFDGKFDEFWQKASQVNNIMVVRDSKYLHWRYFEKPGDEYVVFCAGRKDEIAGFIVLKLETAVLTRGLIIDILTLPDDYLVAELLIKKAIDYFQREGASILSCLMLRDTLYYRILRKLGFTRRDSNIQLNVRLFDQDISSEFISDSSNWYFVWGDTDTR